MTRLDLLHVVALAMLGLFAAAVVLTAPDPPELPERCWCSGGKCLCAPVPYCSCGCGEGRACPCPIALETDDGP